MHEPSRDSNRVVVVGTGPAGAVAAFFLSRAGLAPLVLEAGPQQSLGFLLRVRGVTVGKCQPALRLREDITRVGDPDARIYEALAPGGLSNHWSCAVPRFSEEDFHDAARSGEHNTWPIRYSDLEPWYDAVEPLMKIAAGALDSVHLPRARTHAVRSLGDDWQPVVNAAAGRGRSVVVMPYANGTTSMVTRSATAWNAYSQLLMPAARAGAVEVRHGSAVTRLEWSATERRVVHVVYRDLQTGREERVPCRAVVLAAGAVNTAQIMLQSSSSAFPHGLGNEHDVLGRYLTDHPLAKLTVDLSRPVGLFPASYVTRAALERSTPLYAAACMQWSGTSLLVRSAFGRRPFSATRLGFSVFGTMEPRPENFVALDPQALRHGARPRISISLRHEPLALQTLERGRDELLELLQSVGWGPRLNSWKIEPPGDSVHYSGTCRMHASPQFGVVDHEGRVHGVPNLAIADSSVFTTSPEKNPVLTAMALAARTCDRLARDLQRGMV